MIIRKVEKKPRLALDWQNKIIEFDELVKRLLASKETRGLYILNSRVWIQYFKICENSLHFNLLQRGLPLCRQKHSEIALLKKRFAKEEWQELYAIEKQICDLISVLMPLHNLHTKEPST